MASIRKTKKEVTYLINEVISNGYMALYFQPEEHSDALVEIISKAAELHNQTMNQINHPVEKNNRRLVKKHFAALRSNLLTSVDDLFDQISKVCQG